VLQDGGSDKCRKIRSASSRSGSLTPWTEVSFDRGRDHNQYQRIWPFLDDEVPRDPLFLGTGGQAIGARQVDDSNLALVMFDDPCAYRKIKFDCNGGAIRRPFF
jgi:hypothetical protein